MKGRTSNRLGTGREANGLIPSDSVRLLKGVGPKTEKALAGYSIATIEDLLFLMPIRYEDRRQVRRVCDLVEGEDNSLIATICESGSGFSRSTRRRTYYAKVDDGTGSLVLKWFRFNRRAMSTMCRRGNLLFLSGKVSRFGEDLQIIHPRVTVLTEEDTMEDVARILPVYPEPKGISQGGLRRIIREALAALEPTSITSLIPASLTEQFRLPELAGAVRFCHLPGDFPDESKEPPMDSRGRIVLEEFFMFQTALLLKKREAGAKGTSMKPGKIYARLVDRLPFTLTSGQKEVLTEIERNMASHQAMNRLLQGDVGSGKTICAVLAAAVALDSGYQVAFLAPTEILAEQHYFVLAGLLSDVDVPCVLITGGLKGTERQKAAATIRDGGPLVAVGTHALLQEKVKFPQLGLVIIDEQHRFGVLQRNLLRQKGMNPHVLVMTATPIPRSLSMVIYGDLDVSIIEGMPPGRLKPATKIISEEDRADVGNAIMTEVGKGRQVYAIYPVIDESQDEIKSVKEGEKQLQTLFPSLRIGLLHGRMAADEKRRTMDNFRREEFDLLVSTTVVEVGIDVPNATLMVIEHAERFGLSQLHQLRGRIGRGTDPSHFLLLTASERTSAATKRLRVLEKSNDGFKIAEEDLKLRGPGDVLGVRQTGVPRFRVGNPSEDLALMALARRIASSAILLAREDELSRVIEAARFRWGDKLGFAEVL
jgi:ATP-dependent DNA helicase RecG